MHHATSTEPIYTRNLCVEANSADPDDHMAASKQDLHYLHKTNGYFSVL